MKEAPFVSKLFRQWHCKRLLRTDPLRAMIVGAFVRGLSMRDVESRRSSVRRRALPASSRRSTATSGRIAASLRL
jgi:hypothetical protein